MSLLKIALLGQPEIDHHYHRLTFPSRKTLALLAYLATEGGMHERQKLTHLLWPDSDMAHGRTALRITLHHLRHILAENASLAEQSAHLLISRDTIGLNMLADIDLDLQVLDTASKLISDLSSREALRGEIRRPVIIQLQRAASLYRNKFLHNFTLRDTADFDNWIGVQQSYWAQRIEQVFDWLSQLQREEGALEEAIATTERWCSLDPLNEKSTLRLMQLQFAVGKRIEALKTYETYVQILQEELSAEPSPQLVSLAHLLRNASLSQHKNHDTNIPSRMRTSSAIPLLTIPFVGRASELTTLMTLYELAEHGQPQAVMIEGEAGIGKSRLATVFLDWARASGADVLAGSAFSTAQHFSYQPLLDALHARLSHEHDLHLRLNKFWLTEIARLVPDLRDRYPDLSPPIMREDLASSHLFEALTHLLQALAAQKPQILFIDDMQWADEATLDMCMHLCWTWSRSAIPALLLLNRQAETRIIEPHLAKWFRNVSKTIPFTRLELEPLSTQDMHQMVHLLSGKEEKMLSSGSEKQTCLIRPAQISEKRLDIETFSAWLFTQTQGQPFYIQALLETLLTQGLLIPHFITEKEWILDPNITVLDLTQLHNILPASVREMILHRIHPLSLRARDLLVAGAVLDHHFTFEDLCYVASMTPQEGLAALDEVLENLLLRESGQQGEESNNHFDPSSYTFTHEKIREVVYNKASAARKRVFHQRALTMSKLIHTSAAVSAFHARAAGSIAEAFQWSIAAGDESMKVFAMRDAIEHYEQARQLMTLPEINVASKDLLHLFVQLGSAYKHSNDAITSRAIYQVLLEIAQQKQDEVMECVALNHLAVVEGENISLMKQTLAQLRKALDLAESMAHQELLAHTHWSLSRVYFFAYRVSESFTHAQQAVTLARKSGNLALLAQCLNMLSYLTDALGKWEEALAHAEEARKFYVAQGNRIMEADCLCKVVPVYITNLQPQVAMVTARAAYTIALAVNHTWSLARCGYALARGLVEVGSYEEALSIALQSTDAARDLSLRHLLLMNLATLGSVYRALLQVEQARQIHLEALELSKATISSPRYQEMCASLLCADCVLAGNWQLGAFYARQALANMEPPMIAATEIPRWAEIEALVQVGEEELATAALQIFETYAKTNKRCHITVLRAQAILAQARGDSECAITYLQDAITSAQEVELLEELWQAEVALGNLLCMRQEDASAARVFARARATVEQLTANITNGVLRTQFLQAPQVQQIFRVT